MLDTKAAPGSDARSERPDPGTERPAEGQPSAPAGSPADGGEGGRAPRRDAPNEQPGEPDAAAAGKETPPEAEDFRVKYEDTEAKRRDIQSKYDKLVNEHGPEQTERKLRALDGGWRGWIERNAPDAYAKLVETERTKGQERTAENGARAASERVVLGVYREGDKAFGDYLTDLIESGARITPQSLDRHRETFSKYAGNAHSNGNGAPRADEPPRAAPAAPPAPPRAGGAGRPTVEAPPIWKPEDGFHPRKYLTDGLEAGDARGNKPNPKRALLTGRR